MDGIKYAVIITLLMLILFMLIAGIYIILVELTDPDIPAKPERKEGTTRTGLEAIPNSQDELKPGPFNKL